MKYLISNDSKDINEAAARRKGHDMNLTDSIFKDLGGCLCVDENNEKWLTDIEKSVIVEELPEEYTPIIEEI